jgi:hypothetical protein
MIDAATARIFQVTLDRSARTTAPRTRTSPADNHYPSGC